jgi:hypothetical protein
MWQSGPLLDLGRVPINFAILQPNNRNGSGVEDWRWPSNVSVPVGNWSTGIYIAEIAAYLNGSSTTPLMTNWVEFVVKNPSPQPGTILYKFNINTVHAYNLALHPYVLGRDGAIAPFNNEFYENPATAPGSSPDSTTYQITLRRPVWQFSWGDKSITYDYPFVLWLQKQGYTVDFVTDIDIELDDDLTLLSQYPVVVFRGHDEYLGVNTYNNLIAYRNNGGNIAFLSGNSCCWRVTYGDPDPNTNIPTSFSCDKGPTPLCDINGPDSWWVLGQADSPPAALDNQLIGAGTRNAGIRFEVGGPFTPADPPSPGFKVLNADHWIFARTGLQNGNVIGVGNVSNAAGPIIEGLIGYEGAGALLNPDNTPTFTDGTPPNFVVLGVADTNPYVWACNRALGSWWAFSREDTDPPGGVTGRYAATMGIYSEEGSVFTASTVSWVNILNEWDCDAGFWRTSALAPTNWQPGTDHQGHPILGNLYLHYITRNMFDRFLRKP